MPTFGRMCERPVMESNASILKPHRRILELDALRALAAINLVLFHFTHVYAVKFGYTSPLGFEWPFGAYGVEMFFILSGFVNSMSLLRRGKPVDFVAARMIRIIPVFLLVIIANLWILPLAPMHQSVSAGQFAANMTLLPRVLGYECVDPVMWTLQIEMMFYVSLVTMFSIGALRRYFIGWGTLLMLSVTVCPLLDAIAPTHGDAGWFAAATAVRRLMLLDFVPLFAMGFLLYMIKTGVGKRWQNIGGILIAATVFHLIDHGKHNPAATALILGLVTMCAYGKVPPLRFRPLIYVSTISYALYLCHNNLGCALIHRFDHAGVPPQICLGIAIVFSFAMAIIITNRIEQPLTNGLRKGWSRYRNGETEAADATCQPSGNTPGLNQ
ncbi:Acyltransferase family protein [Rubripirellula lacrimiformis]|uniref:Acyltransferase family protein n=1 Tax=Rubripirellula lacrimiformis TaxID=1930273 RepID=A0A517NHY5_9BACT|nr:acyltransferase [Rubripirellula lacrimiformis]QDT06742.1 Acyltransferase family protein [Rubripirellula lacrimiformis]